jgi:hypothetical protein
MRRAWLPAVVLLLGAATRGWTGSCLGLPDLTRCPDGEDARCLAEVCISDYHEDSARLTERSATVESHLGGEWCRGRLVASGEPLANCTDAAGRIVDCCDPASRFKGLALTVTDGRVGDGDPTTSGYYDTTFWTCDECVTTATRYLTCIGHAAKATIKDRSDLGPGTFGFKLLPRGLDIRLSPGESFVEPITCTVQFLPEERQFRGRYGSGPLPAGSACSCLSTTADWWVRGRLVCDNCADGPSVP